MRPTVSRDELVFIVNEHKDQSNRHIAKKLVKEFGGSLRNYQKRIAAIRNPMIPDGIPDIPEGQGLKGVSALYGADGALKQIWVKSQAEKDRFEVEAREFVESLTSQVRPLAKVKAPKGGCLERVACYNIGDAHIGMLAWAEEAGDDFDLRIAVKDLTNATYQLVADAPRTKECRINNFGDYFHIDNRTYQTEKGGNVLDADNRYLKIVREGIKTMRLLIELALQKHEVVRVRNVQGNHDPHSSITLTVALEALYEKEPRVIIEDSPKDFWSFQWGKCLVALTHGHEIRNPKDMASLLPVENPRAWADSEFRAVWHGHIHHKRLEEHRTILVESFRTLAARDAWHAAKGYGAGREMQCIVLHKDFGEVARHTVPLQRARALENDVAADSPKSGRRTKSRGIAA